MATKTLTKNQRAYMPMARQIMGRLHVGASNLQALRAARKAIAPEHRKGRARRASRHAFYRVCLYVHAENFGLYAYVMGGR